MACTPVYFIVYGICGTSLQFIQNSNLPYRAQSLLYATGKMSLNWELDCSSIFSMHAPAEFWTRNRMNNEIWINKINTGNHEFLF